MGTKIASEQLKGRVFEINLADLNKDEDHAYRKMRLQCEEVQGRYCLTQFYGMDFTTDKLRSLVKKWQTLIEAAVDVKTTDGYVIGFTKKQRPQIRKTSYAQAQQVRDIRAKMVEIVERECRASDLKELVLKFIPESISKEIEKACAGIYPMHDVYVRKVKVLKKPKFDVARLLEIHGDTGATITSDGTVVKSGGDFQEPAAL